VSDVPRRLGQRMPPRNYKADAWHPAAQIPEATGHRKCGACEERARYVLVGLYPRDYDIKRYLCTRHARQLRDELRPSHLSPEKLP
jgi:hypothetical protein